MEVLIILIVFDLIDSFIRPDCSTLGEAVTYIVVKESGGSFLCMFGWFRLNINEEYAR